MRTRLFAACMCALAAVQTTYAAERVTFRNGFSIECTQRVDAGDGRTRLMLEGSSYMDVESSSISAVERMEATRPPGPTISARIPQAASVTDIAQLVASAGNAHNINVALLQSVVNAESGGHVHAVSHAGAAGLMQLMPGTAHALGVHDSFAPAENLRGGATYLDMLLTRYHDNLALALAAYNAGPGAVDKYHGVPPYRETVAYVSRIIREFNRRTLEQQRLAAARPKVTLAGAALP